jgi:hypothetical protein
MSDTPHLSPEARALLAPLTQRIRDRAAYARQVERQARDAVEAAWGAVEEARDDFARGCMLALGRRDVAVNPDTFAVEVLPQSSEPPGESGGSA